ncbi:fimbrial protein [Enterobacteriaceae bacterium LUAb1]
MMRKKVTLIIGLMVVLTEKVNAADFQTINFNIEIPAFTCTVTPADMTYSGAVNGVDAIGSNWKTLAPQDLTVRLTGCAGVAQSGKAPTLTIEPASGTTVSNHYVFRDVAQSTAKGFGVAIFNKAASDITQNSTSDMVASGDAVWRGGAGTIPSARTIVLATGVTCGPISSCMASGLGTGSVQASIVFILGYP